MSEKAAKQIRAMGRDKAIATFQKYIDAQEPFRQAVGHDIELFQRRLNEVEEALQYMHQQMARVEDIEQGLGMALQRLAEIEARPWWWSFRKQIRRGKE
ncbi:MAG: hypothetical protein ABIJ57_12495 [Pseudomonadota bacterium]